MSFKLQQIESLIFENPLFRPIENGRVGGRETTNFQKLPLDVEQALKFEFFHNDPTLIGSRVRKKLMRSSLKSSMQPYHSQCKSSAFCVRVLRYQYF